MFGRQKKSEVTGEEVLDKFNKILEDNGLKGEIGFVMYEMDKFDVVMHTPDVIVLGRVPGSGGTVMYPWLDELLDNQEDDDND